MVVFLDLLGFKQTVNRIFSLPDFEAFERLLAILGGVSQREEQESRGVELAILGETRSWKTSKLHSGSSRVEISAFSDSVVLSAKAEDRGPLWTLFLAGLTMLQLIEEGVSSRGAADIGAMHHAGGVFVGPAVIRAYKLDCEVGDLPRLLVTDALAAHVRTLGEHDSLAPLRPTEAGFEHLDVFRLVDGEDERVFERFGKLRQGLERLISEAEKHPDSEKRTKIVERQLWLANEFNREVKARSHLQIEPIPIVED